MSESGNFDSLPELHSLSCGLKVLLTQESADAIDVLRKSCGGHGFMSSSNLPRYLALTATAVVWFFLGDCSIQIEIETMLVAVYARKLSFT